MPGERGTTFKEDGPRLLVFAGPPSAGKSAVIRQIVPRLTSLGERPPYYVKVDVVRSRELRLMERLGWTSEALVEPDFCPDQTWFERLPAVIERASGAPLLIAETAGLCARCSPYVLEGVAIVVFEATAGLDTVDKLGPLMSTADLAVVTHGDRLSQGERDLLRARLAQRHPSEAIHFLNGLTGEGSARVARLIDGRLAASPRLQPGETLREALTPRSAPPRLFCSLCLGRKDLPILDAPMVSSC